MEPVKRNKKSTVGKTMSVIQSKSFDTNWVFNHPTEESDFCLNHCPHPDILCDGNCEEWQQFAKTLYKEQIRK